MPEGPEVFIIASVLNNECQGKKILDINIHKDSKYIIKEKINVEPFVKYIDDRRFDPCIGKKILEIQSKGKKIIFALGASPSDKSKNLSYLLSSLALEGRWSVEKSFPEDTKHLSVSIRLSPSPSKSSDLLGATPKGEYLLFRDTRHFGDLVYYKDREDLSKSLKSVGPSWIPSDMFPERINLKMFTELLQSNTRIKNKPIMTFLMDQKYTSGVGNYIRAEALYIARINPNKTIGSLTSDEIEKLYIAINKVMTAALKSGGHTLKSYFSPVGTVGGYMPIVYGRTRTSDTNMPVIRELDSQKRAIHWVPSLQL